MLFGKMIEKASVKLDCESSDARPLKLVLSQRKLQHNLICRVVAYTANKSKSQIGSALDHTIFAAAFSFLGEENDCFSCRRGWQEAKLRAIL